MNGIREGEQNQRMEEKEKPSGQTRVSLEADIAEVVDEKAPGDDTRKNSRFVNDCLRAYFISRGWMTEAKVSEKKESA